MEPSFCTICQQAPFTVRLTCGCNGYCQECIVDWFEVQLKGQFTSEATSLICPTGNSRHEIPFEEVFDIIKGSPQESNVEQLILRMRFRAMGDAVFCPKEGCDYVGWIDKAMRCMQPVECEGCGNSWTEDQLVPDWRRLGNQGLRMVAGQDESFSFVWKDLWTSLCPRCGVSIEKDGGCSHMVCYKCKLNFCWSCMRPFRSHDNITCFLRTLTYVCVYAVFVTLLVLKLMWICGMFVEFFSKLGTVLIALGFVMLNFAMFEVIGDFRRVLCQVFVFAVFVAAQYASYIYSEACRHGIELCAVGIVAALHCSLGFAYLKH